MSEDVSRITDETLHNIGTILSNFSSEGKRLIRSLESVAKKHINTRYAVIFNNFCIQENLLPKFTNIRKCIFIQFKSFKTFRYVVIWIYIRSFIMTICCFQSNFVPEAEPAPSPGYQGSVRPR